MWRAGGRNDCSVGLATFEVTEVRPMINIGLEEGGSICEMHVEFAKGGGIYFSTKMTHGIY